MDARSQLANLARRHGVPERRAIVVALRLEQEERNERSLRALSRILGPWLEEPEDN